MLRNCHNWRDAAATPGSDGPSCDVSVGMKIGMWMGGAVGLVIFLAACASTRIPAGPIDGAGDDRAAALLERAREAQGGVAFDRVRDLSVRYDGTWGAIGPKFQPVLVDQEFRKGSEERLILGTGLVAQRHEGVGGTKVVRRTGAEVSVLYNGKTAADDEVRAAAALVADAYELFLLGPFYFRRAGVTLAMAGEGRVGGEVCDQVLAVVRPGFGFSEEDRVVLSFERRTGRLVRVRMTLNGLASTAGAEVDVTFSEFREVGGVLWPTVSVERIRSPFDLFAHRWTMEGLRINRGLKVGDLSLPAIERFEPTVGFSGYD